MQGRERTDMLSSLFCLAVHSMHAVFMGVSMRLVCAGVSARNS